MARTSIGKSENKQNDRELKSCSFSGMVGCKKRQKIFIVYVIRKKRAAAIDIKCMCYIHLYRVYCV